MSEMIETMRDCAEVINRWLPVIRRRGNSCLALKATEGMMQYSESTGIPLAICIAAAMLETFDTAQKLERAKTGGAK